MPTNQEIFNRKPHTPSAQLELQLNDCRRSLEFLDFWRKGACQTFFTKNGTFLAQNTLCEEVAVRQIALAERCFKLSAQGTFVDDFGGKITKTELGDYIVASLTPK